MILYYTILLYCIVLYYTVPQSHSIACSCARASRQALPVKAVRSRASQEALATSASRIGWILVEMKVPGLDLDPIQNYIYTYVYIYIYIDRCVYIYMCVYICKCVHIYIYTHIYLYACMYVYIYRCIYICTVTNTHIYTYSMYVYVRYVYIYIYIHIWCRTCCSHGDKEILGICGHENKFRDPRVLHMIGSPFDGGLQVQCMGDGAK